MDTPPHLQSPFLNRTSDGHWIGIFTQKGEKTEVDFTENVTAKKVLMKPFVKAYLKKQQAIYVKDLARELKGNYDRKRNCWLSKIWGFRKI